MSFTPVPFPGQSLGQTRDVIRGDLNVLRSTIAVDHYDVNAVSNVGMHKIIEMPEQTTFLTTPANQGNAFCRDYNSRTEMMFQPESTLDTGDQFCLSAMPIRASALFTANAANGVCALLGRSFNILSITKSGTSQNFTYDVLFTASNPTISVNYLIIPFASLNQLTSTHIASIRISNKLVTGFTISILENTGAPSEIQFIVLGG